ncbi:unnamed protein product [Ectocarpus fasciculatus]
MHNDKPAAVPAPNNGLVIIPQSAPQAVGQHSGCCCAPMGANSDVKAAHGTLIAILVTHTIQLFGTSIVILVTCIIQLSFGTIGTTWGSSKLSLTIVSWCAAITAIVASSVILCAGTKVSYGVGAALYLLMGNVDIFSTVVWVSRENTTTSEVMILVTPGILGTVFCFLGSWWTSKAAYNWDKSSGTPEAPRGVV